MAIQLNVGLTGTANCQSTISPMLHLPRLVYCGSMQDKILTVGLWLRHDIEASKKASAQNEKMQMPSKST